MPSLFPNLSRDAYRIVRAVPMMWDDISKRERIDCSISLFSATSFDAVRSQPAEYLLVIVNGTPQALLRKIQIVICERNRPVHREGHYACFDRSFCISARKSCEIKLTYDWAEHAQFIVDGVELPPDSFWRGDCNAPGRYAVYAVLSDESGIPSESLFIVQDFKP